MFNFKKRIRSKDTRQLNLVLLYVHISMLKKKTKKGGLFFRFHDGEQRKQEKVGVDMTWVDAFYYATVIATTVG
jgi:hypothetical protein